MGGVTGTVLSYGVGTNGAGFIGIAIFLLGFGGLIVSLWPYVIPRSVTIWAGAADPQSLRFIGVGLLLVLPIVLAYQAHTCWVFRGKTVVEHGD